MLLLAGAAGVYTYLRQMSAALPASIPVMSRCAMSMPGKATAVPVQQTAIRTPVATGASLDRSHALVITNATDKIAVVAWSDQDVARLVLHLQDPAIGAMERLKEIEALAQQGGAFAAQVLEGLGDAQNYLNYAAVTALGKVQAPGVTDYLKSKLTDGDPRVLSAAVGSLAKQQGAAAVQDITAVVKRNRQRADGFQDTVCAACVQALADTKSPLAIPLLDAELRESVGTTLQYAYGSQVVQALAVINNSAARPVLLAYANRLTVQAQKAGDNPMGQLYLQEKIREALTAAEALPK